MQGTSQVKRKMDDLDGKEGRQSKRHSLENTKEGPRDDQKIDNIFRTQKATTLSYTRKPGKASIGQPPPMEEMYSDIPGASAKHIKDPPPFSLDSFRCPGAVKRTQTRDSIQGNSEMHSTESRTTSFSSSASRSRVFSAAESVSNRTSFTEPSTSSQEAVNSFIRAEDPATDSMKSKPIHWHVRDLPIGGLFAERDHPKLEEASSRVRYECTRMVSGLQLPAKFLDEADMRSLEDYDLLWERLHSSKPKNLAHFPKCLPKTWSQAEDNTISANVCRTASLTFHHGPRSNEKPGIFKLTLQPLRDERSCRFFRKFGSDRFLKVSLPSCRNEDLPEYLKGYEDRITGGISEWLAVPDKEFLGCNWSVFCVKPHKDRKSKRKMSQQASESRGADVFLFATKGPGLRSVTIGELLEWFMPIRTNQELSACKAFARIELGLSKTIATLEFRPSQVREIQDTFADGSPEDTAFNDKGMDWTEANRIESNVIMNDGCARLSSAAAKQIWELLREPGSCASTFQARIGPWKGVWMVSPPKLGEEDELWIEVTDSQRKFVRHTEDSDDAEFDRHRLTFEVLQWSHKPTSNYLHGDYLPILEERGVPRGNIDKLVRHVLDEEKEQLLRSLASSQALYKWIEDRYGSSNDFEEEESTRQASTEITQVTEVIKFLLDAGFDFDNFQYLQHLVKAFASDWFKRVTAELKFPVPKSTTVLGVADPLNVLKPGEVHLSFSGTLGDSGDVLLDGIEALVGRHPSCRRSDLQKVKMVYHPKLRHLVDVVVFPSRGVFPLAGKLQGGDYDGDKFWVCWEPPLVDPFQNAPAPRAGANPKKLCIRVDRAKLGELVDYDAPGSLERFLSRTLRFSMQPALLGIVTNTHTNVCYSENRISSHAIDRLADLHDLLVDSAKNGYSFDSDCWTTFQERNCTVGMDRMKPAYKRIDKNTLFEKDVKRFDFNPDHIIDHIVFETARDHALQIIAHIDGINSGATPSDRGVEALYNNAMASGDANLIHSLDAAKIEMEKAFISWKAGNRTALGKKSSSTQDETNTRFRKAIRDAVDSYRLISVLEEDKPALTSSGWLRELGPGRPTHWALLKASLLFQMFREKKATGVDDFIFKCDGINICDIKAHSVPGQRPNVSVPAMHNQMRMRKVKASLSYEGSFTAGSFDSGESQAVKERLEPGLVQAMGQAELRSWGEHNDDGNDTEFDEDF